MRERYGAKAAGSCGMLFACLLGTANVASAQDRVGVPRVERSDQRSVVDSPGQIVETVFVQSAIEADAVDDCVIGDVRPAGKSFCVRLANLGDDADGETISWDIGRYTGFRPGGCDGFSLYQRGPKQSAEGTAVQLRGTEIGIWIDSDRPRPRRGSLVPVCPAYWWWDVNEAPRPFQQTNHELSFSFDLKVPTAKRQGRAEVYICAHLLLRDRRSGLQFWLGASLFDLRGADRFPDTVHVDNWEAGTKLPILFSALNDHSAWLHPGPNSVRFTDRPFDAYRRFDFRVGPAEVRTAVAAMKNRWPDLANASEDAGDYQLTHFNLNPEVYAPDGSRGQLGLAVRDIRVLLVTRSAP